MEARVSFNLSIDIHTWLYRTTTNDRSNDIKEKIKNPEGNKTITPSSTNLEMKELSTNARHEGFVRVAVKIARVILFSGWAVRKRGLCSGVLASTST